MFVFNVKINSSWIKKIAITGVVLLMCMVFILVGYRFYDNTSNVIVNDEVSNSNDNNYIEINSNNYTSILQDSHENVDKYVGKKVKFTGFIYRLYDFSDDEFVLAREMVISSDNHAVIVGFMCKSTDSIVPSDKVWVEIEGTIVKGEYHGERPIIKIESIKETSVPIDEFVYPPDGSFVNTEI